MARGEITQPTHATGCFWTLHKTQLKSRDQMLRELAPTKQRDTDDVARVGRDKCVVSNDANSGREKQFA